MTVTINILAEDAFEAQQQMLQLLEGRPNALRSYGPQAGQVIHAATVGETIDVGFDPVAAAASAASKVETVTPTDIIIPIKKSRKKAGPKDQVEEPAAPAQPTEDASEEEVLEAAKAIVATETPITRDDVMAMIKHLHQQQGDTFLPKVLTVLAGFGAKKQSEVKEEDLPQLYAKLCELKG